MKSISETNHNVSDAMRCFMRVNWILVWRRKKTKETLNFLEVWRNFDIYITIKL